MVRLRQFSSILIALTALTGPAVAQVASGANRAGVDAPPALLKRIDIKFTNASVFEAAALLSKASGVPIHVDPSVPNDTRLSIDAHGMNAGSVLMTIANQNDLRIDPDDGGVILRPYPYQVVNGAKSVQKNPSAPWGPEWSQPVGIPKNPVGPASMSVSSSRAEQSSAADSPEVFRGVPTTTVSPAAPDSHGAGVAVTALNDHMVMVALPGENDKGVHGVWLALFVVNGSEIRWLSSAFHALGGAPAHAVASGAGTQ